MYKKSVVPISKTEKLARSHMYQQQVNLSNLYIYNRYLLNIWLPLPNLLNNICNC